MTSLLVATLLAAGAAADGKPVVSVLYFENSTGVAEFDVLKKGLAEMMVTDLVAWDGVTVVERERLEAVLGELKLQQTKAFDKSTAVKIGKLVGAKYVIGGSIQRQQEELRVNADIINVETRLVVTTATVRDHQDKIFEIEQQLIEKLTIAIDLKLKDPAQRKRAKAPSFDALLQYSKAIDLSDRGRLEEAQKAMAALVSKSPTFGMARERKQALLEKIKEFEARKKDLVSAGVLEVGRLADAELARANAYPSMTLEQKKRFLAMRALKLRYLARVLKQSLSFRTSLRVVRVGREGEALKVMRAIADGLRDFGEELVAYQKVAGTWDRSVEFAKLGIGEQVRDSGLFGTQDAVQLEAPPVKRALLAFVLDGEVDDGEDFRVAPPLGVLVPQEHELALAAYEQAIADAEAAWKAGPAEQKLKLEGVLVDALMDRAEVMVRLRRDEDAARSYQRVLDEFPTSSDASKAERAIQVIIGGVHDSGRVDRERYQRALKMCDGLHNIAQELGWRVRRFGLPGLDQVVGEVEKACLGRLDVEGGIGSFYMSAADDAASHEDCARAKRYYLKAYAFGNIGPRSFDAYFKNEPWCDYGLASEEQFPMKVAIHARSGGELAKALRDVLAEELRARGVAVQAGEGTSHGGVASLWVDVSEKGGELSIEFDLWNSEPRSIEARDVTFTSSKGALDVPALIAPVLKYVPPGLEPSGPFVKTTSLPVALLVEYSKLLDQFEDARYHKERFPEIQRAFEALAKKAPGFRLASVRAAMAASRQVSE